MAASTCSSGVMSPDVSSSFSRVPNMAKATSSGCSDRLLNLRETRMKAEKAMARVRRRDAGTCLAWSERTAHVGAQATEQLYLLHVQLHDNKLDT
jgi:hypothetical protein